MTRIVYRRPMSARGPNSGRKRVSRKVFEVRCQIE